MTPKASTMLVSLAVADAATVPGSHPGAG